MRTGKSNGRPVVVDGVVYYATRGFREFDGQVMARVGLFEGVPIYADTTLEPFSELYVPVGGARLRAYEWRRDGALASTSASRVPTFPLIVRSRDATRGAASGGVVNPADGLGGTAAPYEPRPAPASATTNTADRDATTRTVMQSIPGPGANNGIWLEFNHAVVRGRTRHGVFAGPVRTAWRGPRLSRLPRQNARRRRDLGCCGKDGRAVAPYAKR